MCAPMAGAPGPVPKGEAGFGRQLLKVWQSSIILHDFPLVFKAKPALWRAKYARDAV